MTLTCSSLNLERILEVIVLRLFLVELGEYGTVEGRVCVWCSDDEVC